MKNMIKVLVVIAILALALFAFTGCFEPPVNACEHTGGTATCTELAICELCGEGYGELGAHIEQIVSAKAPTCTETGLSSGVKCALCGSTLEEQEPVEALGHKWADATCTAAKTCETCSATEGEALGHTEVVDVAVEATCTTVGLSEGKHCSVCNEVLVAQNEVKKLPHKIAYVTTLPTADAQGKTVGTCSLCEGTFEYDAVSLMNAGTYVLEASDLSGIAQYSLSDGEVKVVKGVFECHLSNKYRTDDGQKKTFPDDYYGTSRMNFGGKTEINSEANPDMIKNGIVITTTGTTTVKIWWVEGGDDKRQVALYNMDGTIAAQTEETELAKNAPCVSTLTVPAGTYIIGNTINSNYYFKIEVVVEEDPIVLPDGITAESFGENLVAAIVDDTVVYYAGLKQALEAIHTKGIDTLYCKPEADLGTITHAHVCSSLTIYGNNAFISAGESDIELDTYKFCHNGADTCEGIKGELTLNVYRLHGVAVWGQRTTENTLNINLIKCDNINRVYISGTTGINNINIDGGSVDGANGYKNTAIYTNAAGDVTIANVTFNGYAVPININNKSTGTQNITITNCEFIDCATPSLAAAEGATEYAAPIRVVATTEESAICNLTVNNCKFTFTGEEQAVDGNILILDKREGKPNNGTVNLIVDGVAQ